MNEEPINTFPVVGWDLKGVAAMDAVLLTIPFLASPMQPASAPNPGRTYVMHTAQALELAAALQRAVEAVRSAPFPPVPGPKN